MTYAPVMPLILIAALAGGCHSTDPRMRRIANEQSERTMLIRFEPMADDYLDAKASSWAKWIAWSAGVAGLAGGGGLMKAWKDRNGKDVKA